MGRGAAHEEEGEDEDADEDEEPDEEQERDLRASDERKECDVNMAGFSSGKTL